MLFWIACLFGHGFIMKELANHQIDVLVTNRRGLNALHLACTLNYFSIAKMLIQSGFPLHNECSQGMTAI
jgi:ankyrin repeat protein